MRGLPTVSEAIGAEVAKVASIRVEPLPSEVSAKLLKLAQAVNDMPDPEPTYADIYFVKEALCGR